MKPRVRRRRVSWDPGWTHVLPSSTPPGSLLCQNHPPFFPAPQGNASVSTLPFHTLQHASLASTCHVKSSRKWSLPVNLSIKPIYTEATRRSTDSRSQGHSLRSQPGDFPGRPVGRTRLAMPGAWVRFLVWERGSYQPAQQEEEAGDPRSSPRRRGDQCSRIPALHTGDWRRMVNTPEIKASPARLTG